MECDPSIKCQLASRSYLQGHSSIGDKLALFHEQPVVNSLPRFSPQLISLERYTLSVYRAGELDLFKNLDIVHIRLLVVRRTFKLRCTTNTAAMNAHPLRLRLCRARDNRGCTKKCTTMQASAVDLSLGPRAEAHMSHPLRWACSARQGSGSSSQLTHKRGRQGAVATQSQFLVR